MAAPSIYSASYLDACEITTRTRIHSITRDVRSAPLTIEPDIATPSTIHSSSATARRFSYKSSLDDSLDSPTVLVTSIQLLQPNQLLVVPDTDTPLLSSKTLITSLHVHTTLTNMSNRKMMLILAALAVSVQVQAAVLPVIPEGSDSDAAVDVPVCFSLKVPMFLITDFRFS